MNWQDSVHGIPAEGEELPDPAKTVQLLRHSKDGDRAALNEIFARYQPRLRRVVRIKMGAHLRRHLDPDDIVQETCIVAMEKLPTFEIQNQASMLQWLTRIASYQIKAKLRYMHAQKRDAAREQRIRQGDSNDDTTSVGLVVAQPGPTPSQIISREELERIVDECVEALDPPDYREVILLRDYYGADWEDVRRQLERPTVDAVRELYRRAHRKLREKARAHGLR